MSKDDQDMKKKLDSDIVSVRKDIVKAWTAALKETFMSALDASRGDLDAMISVGTKLDGLVADTTWKEDIWKNGGNSWRKSWHDDDALTNRASMVSNPVDFLDQIRVSIQEIAKMKK
ncbi:MAG: hypothetical protein B5M56_01785 [Desulfococcus sp. 4484_241]|nr:MAG: hypothetical protein B5M56_01785 [Desulfococcus sp. 4484_241]